MFGHAVFARATVGAHPSHLRLASDTDSLTDYRGGWGELSGKESRHTVLYEKVCGLGNN